MGRTEKKDLQVTKKHKRSGTTSRIGRRFKKRKPGEEAPPTLKEKYTTYNTSLLGKLRSKRYRDKTQDQAKEYLRNWQQRVSSKISQKVSTAKWLQRSPAKRSQKSRTAKWLQGSPAKRSQKSRTAKWLQRSPAKRSQKSRTAKWLQGSPAQRSQKARIAKWTASTPGRKSKKVRMQRLRIRLDKASYGTVNWESIEIDASRREALKLIRDQEDPPQRWVVRKFRKNKVLITGQRKSVYLPKLPGKNLARRDRVSAIMSFRINAMNSLKKTMKYWSDDTLSNLYSKIFKDESKKDRTGMIWFLTSYIVSLVLARHDQWVKNIYHCARRLNEESEALLAVMKKKSKKGEDVFLGLNCHTKSTEPKFPKCSYHDGKRYSFKKAPDRINSCTGNCIVASSRDSTIFKEFLHKCSELDCRDAREFIQKVYVCDTFVKTPDEDIYMLPVEKRNHPIDCHEDKVECGSTYVVLQDLAVHYRTARKFAAITARMKHAENFLCDIHTAILLGDVNFLMLLLSYMPQVAPKSFSIERNEEQVDMAAVVKQYPAAAKHFAKEISDVPTNVCFSCNMLVRDSKISKITKRFKHTSNAAYTKMLDYYNSDERRQLGYQDPQIVSLVGQQICTPCKRKLNNNETPSNSLVNGLDAGKRPASLEEMNSIEHMFIRQMSMFQTWVRIGTSSGNDKMSERMYQMKGNAVHMPLPIEDTISQLKENTEKKLLAVENFIKIVGLSKHSKSFWHKAVNVERVFTVLRWLKVYHPDYKTIKLPDSPQQLLSFSEGSDRNENGTKPTAPPMENVLDILATSSESDQSRAGSDCTDLGLTPIRKIGDQSVYESDDEYSIPSTIEFTSSDEEVQMGTIDPTESQICILPVVDLTKSRTNDMTERPSVENSNAAGNQLYPVFRDPITGEIDHHVIQVNKPSGTLYPEIGTSTPSAIEKSKSGDTLYPKIRAPITGEIDHNVIQVNKPSGTLYPEIGTSTPSAIEKSKSVDTLYPKIRDPITGEIDHHLIQVNKPSGTLYPEIGTSTPSVVEQSKSAVITNMTKTGLPKVTKTRKRLYPEGPDDTTITADPTEQLRSKEHDIEIKDKGPMTRSRAKKEKVLRGGAVVKEQLTVKKRKERAAVAILDLASRLIYNLELCKNCYTYFRGVRYDLVFNGYGMYSLEVLESRAHELHDILSSNSTLTCPGKNILSSCLSVKTKCSSAFKKDVRYRTMAMELKNQHLGAMRNLDKLATASQMCSQCYITIEDMQLTKGLDVCKSFKDFRKFKLEYHFVLKKIDKLIDQRGDSHRRLGYCAVCSVEVQPDFLQIEPEGDRSWADRQDSYDIGGPPDIQTIRRHAAPTKLTERTLTQVNMENLNHVVVLQKIAIEYRMVCNQCVNQFAGKRKVYKRMVSGEVFHSFGCDLSYFDQNTCFEIRRQTEIAFNNCSSSGNCMSCHTKKVDCKITCDKSENMVKTSEQKLTSGGTGSNISDLKEKKKETVFKKMKRNMETVKQRLSSIVETRSTSGESSNKDSAETEDSEESEVPPPNEDLHYSGSSEEMDQANWRKATIDWYTVKLNAFRKMFAEMAEIVSRSSSSSSYEESASGSEASVGVFDKSGRAKVSDDELKIPIPNCDLNYSGSSADEDADNEDSDETSHSSEIASPSSDEEFDESMMNIQDTNFADELSSESENEDGGAKVESLEVTEEERIKMIEKMTPEEFKTKIEPLTTTALGNPSEDWEKYKDDLYKLLKVDTEPIRPEEEKVEILCFPNLFPRGIGVKRISRPIKTNPLIYEKTRLFSADEAYRQDMPYCFYLASEHERRKIKQSIFAALRNVGSMKNMTVQELLARVKKNDANLVRKMTRCLTNIPGTEQYWSSAKVKLDAQLEKFGSPTWFLTLSPAEWDWPELIDYLRKVNSKRPGVDKMTPNELITLEPVLTSAYIHQRFEAVFKFIFDSGCLGKIKSYFIRQEYQGRGTVHFHTLLWIENAPVIGKDSDEKVAKFIQEFVTCRIPDAAKEPELHRIVSRYQKHRCQKYCLYRVKGKRGKHKTSCRFGFPRKVCKRFLLRDVTATVLGRRSGKFKKRLYEVPRVGDERFINDYNPIISLLWKGNMDLQFMGEDSFSIANYVSKYTTKCEKTNMDLQFDGDESDTKRFYKFAYSNMRNRTMSAQEAADRILQRNGELWRSSENFQWVSATLPKYRSRTLRQIRDLEGADPKSKRLFCRDVVNDFYPNRPKSLENMSLATFSSSYAKCYDDRYVSLVIKDKFGVTLGKFRKLKKAPVIYSNRYSLKEKPELFYHNLLMLYKPWRKEEDILGESSSYEREFYRCADSGSYAELVNGAAVKINIEKGRENMKEREKEAKTTAKQPNSTPSSSDEDETPLLQSLKDYEANQDGSDITTLEELDKVVATLNKDQRRCYDKITNFFNHKFQHLTGECSCNNTDEPLLLFISGPGGTGKSYLIEAIVGFMQTAALKYNTVLDNGVLIAAPTGVAARNVKGQTLTSILRLPVEHDNTPGFKLLKKNVLDQMRSVMANLGLLIIDEISMVSNVQLFYTHLRLGQIFGEKNGPFGGKAVIVFGDLLQLPPVNANPVFTPISADLARELTGALPTKHDLWHDFQFEELEINQRQKGNQNSLYRELLGRLRIGAITNKDVQLLKSRLIPLLRSTTSEEYLEQLVDYFVGLLKSAPQLVTLLPTREMVDTFNKAVLRKLHPQVTVVTAKDELSTKKSGVARKNLLKAIKKLDGENDPRKTGALEKQLPLAIGVRVMLRRNMNVKAGLTNGSIGEIREIVKVDGVVEHLRVQFDGVDGVTDLRRDKREVMAYHNGYFHRSQFPICLSYGMTIHKSQGLSLTSAMVDIGKGTFADGQAYVALSRVKTLTGLHLINFAISSVKANANTIRHYAARGSKSIALAARKRALKESGTGSERIWYPTTTTKKVKDTISSQVDDRSLARGKRRKLFNNSPPSPAKKKAKVKNLQDSQPLNQNIIELSDSSGYDDKAPVKRKKGNISLPSFEEYFKLVTEDADMRHRCSTNMLESVQRGQLKTIYEDIIKTKIKSLQNGTPSGEFGLNPDPLEECPASSKFLTSTDLNVFVAYLQDVMKDEKRAGLDSPKIFNMGGGIDAFLDRVGPLGEGEAVRQFAVDLFAAFPLSKYSTPRPYDIFQNIDDGGDPAAHDIITVFANPTYAVVGHWFLVLIDNRNNTVHYYDSAASSQVNIKVICQRYVKFVQSYRRYLTTERNININLDSFDPDSFSYLNGHSQRQTNGFDCGVFALGNLYSYIRGLDKKVIQNSTVQHIREGNYENI
eukprot:sb/3460355/